MDDIYYLNYFKQNNKKHKYLYPIYIDNIDLSCNILLYGQNDLLHECIVYRIVENNLGISSTDLIQTIYHDDIPMIRFKEFISINLYNVSVSCVKNIIEFLKELSLTKTINNTNRIICLYNFDYISQYYQLTLRRIIEKSTNTVRYIITTTHINAIIETIRSRFMPFRIPNITESNLKTCLNDILSKHEIKVTPKKIDKYVNYFNNDLINCLLYLNLINAEKQYKGHNTYVNDIVNYFKTCKKTKNLDTLVKHTRELLKTFIKTNINNTRVQHAILNVVVKESTSITNTHNIVKIIASSNENMLNSNRLLYHYEEMLYKIHKEMLSWNSSIVNL